MSRCSFNHSIPDLVIFSGLSIGEKMLRYVYLKIIISDLFIMQALVFSGKCINERGALSDS